MGSTAAPAPGVERPATRLFVTPPGEIALCCRLALAARLAPRLSFEALRFILEEQAPGERTEDLDRDTWSRARREIMALSVIDPACGEGDFLLGMLALLAGIEASIASRLGQAHDERDALAHICSRQLLGIEVERDRLTRARRRLRKRSGAEPVLVADDSLLPRFSPAQQRITAGGFDLVVGNPPYVRHELIDDPLGWLPPGEYRQTVARSLGQRLSGAAELHDAGACLDTRCDLSALFLAHGLSLLKPDGAMALVIPSALFQARYGSAVLQLLRRSNRDAILAESFTHRSFAGAEVNTSVLLVTPQRLGPAGNRLQRVDVEGRPSELHASLVWQAAGRTSISSGGRNAIPRPVRLGDLGRLRYPIKTGLNAFFYLRPEAITSFEIEPRYCRPVLKSPRQVGCISLHPRVLPTMAFVCTDDPTTMGCGAARYVAWGAGQKTIRGDFWSQAPSVRGRRWWYTLPLPPPADILCPRFFDRRLFFVLPCEQVLEDQTFYGLILAPPLAGRRELIGALLNSSPACLMLEQHGRTGLGDGARQYALCDLADLPIPDPNRVPDALVEPIVAAFRRMAARRILPVAEEMRQSDRLALDALVGEALAIPDGRAAEIREEAVRLVERRLARARRRHD